ncbi:MAG: ATP-binding protein [Bacteroidota bacterium]
MIDSEIKTDRILLFFGALIYPFWGYIYFVLNPGFDDPFWHRYVISGYILAVFSGTFLFPARRRLIDNLNYSIIYIVTVKQAQLIHFNDLSYEYFIGYIVIIVSLISYFKTMRQIVVYSSTCVLLILLIFVLDQDFYLSRLLFYVSAIFTITFFLSFIYYIKIVNQQKLLEYSIQQVETEKELSEIRSKLQEKEITEQLSRAKSEFISKMSHEIRTPLNGIYGFSNLLLKEQLNREQMQYVENIKFSSNLLKTLIDDILDNSKIEAGKIKLEEEELQIAELFNSVAGNFEDLARRKNIRLNMCHDAQELPGDIVLLGDSLRISQIILNLMSNAIKFSEENREISINVSTGQLAGGNVDFSFSIANYGISIPEEQLQEIFQPYVQVSNDMSRKYGGTGLGLTIVKSLVEMMHGSISVSSGEQTVFSVSIPLKTKARQAEKPAAITGSVSKTFNSKLHKILVAEDNPMNQFLISTVLEKNGFRFKVVENGDEVLEEIERAAYGLILMDIMMPVKDGITCTRILREELHLKIPVVALTADIKTKSQPGFDGLFDAYIKKPFEEEELLDVIRKLT